MSYTGVHIINGGYTCIQYDHTKPACGPYQHVCYISTYPGSITMGLGSIFTCPVSIYTILIPYNVHIFSLSTIL